MLCLLLKYQVALSKALTCLCSHLSISKVESYHRNNFLVLPWMSKINSEKHCIECFAKSIEQIVSVGRKASWGSKENMRSCLLLFSILCLFPWLVSNREPVRLCYTQMCLPSFSLLVWRAVGRDWENHMLSNDQEALPWVRGESS